jgi:thioredoxin-dependent peroxiredoxin
MRLKPGDSAPSVRLPNLDGVDFDTADLSGEPYLISFYRFASCPFCNLRVRELASRKGELPDRFGMVAVFAASLEELTRHVAPDEAPFPVLADREGIAYESYHIEHSVIGVLKGMMTRMPTLMRGMARHGLPNMSEGGMTIMPADFLVDGQGVIHTAYYGRDEGDHISFDAIKTFSRS